LKLRLWHWPVLVICLAVACVALYHDHQVTEGQKAFARLGCESCHLAGGAPSLEHVGRKYDRKTFVDFLSDPETIYARRAHRPLNHGYEPMPRLPASRHDVEALSWFLAAQR